MNTADLLEDGDDHALHQAHDLLAIDERHFQVDLGKLGLPIVAEVFVAEAPGNLIIAIHAADHQDLLEELGRLRQRKELSGVDAARHQIVSGTLRCALRQNRRFHLQESLGIHELSRGLRNAVAKTQQPLHPGAAQVQEPVLQSNRLRDVGLIIDQERWCLGLVENLHIVDEDLDLTGRKLRIL